jgi:chromosomal replication initiator protein
MARAAHVRAFRDAVWPPQRPSAPQPAPEVPEATAPVLTPPLSGIVPGRTSVKSVLEMTAFHFGTTVGDLLAESRKHPVVRRRQIAMFIAHKLTGRSYPFIADKFGGFDHTTILHGVRAVRARIDSGDAATVEAVNAIVERLTGGANV